MTGTRFVEGDLSFEFDENWRLVMPWDKHPAYREGIQKLDESKAVDIVGVHRDGLVVFVEVKDFRVHERSKPMSLWVELELKVRNTVAGLLGASRRQEYKDACQPVVISLLRPGVLKLVFWIEQPQGSGKLEVLRKRHAVSSGTAMKKVDRYVKWLNARVVGVSQDVEYERYIPGLTVQNLPRRRRELAESIVKTLQDRQIPLSDAALVRIGGHLVVEDLETWHRRAAEVMTVEELFGGAR